MGYLAEIVREKQRRGFADSCWEKTLAVYEAHAERSGTLFLGLPLWDGLPGFHEAMRGNLVRKDPEHYGPLFPDADPAAEYVWPVRSRRKVLTYHPALERKTA